MDIDGRFEPSGEDEHHLQLEVACEAEIERREAFIEATGATLDVMIDRALRLAGALLVTPPPPDPDGGGAECSLRKPPGSRQLQLVFREGFVNIPRREPGVSAHIETSALKGGAGFGPWRSVVGSQHERTRVEAVRRLLATVEYFVARAIYFSRRHADYLSGELGV